MMRAKEGVRRLGSRLMGALLRPAWLRRRLVFALRQGHFAELNLCVPIGGGLVAPILTADSVHSFGEIFCGQEYAGIFGLVPAPRRWIDLGAHAGYFTLLLAARHAAARSGGDWEALLVEPDPRIQPALSAALALNGLGGRTRILAGVVGAADRGAGTCIPFVLRSAMASSADLGLPGRAGVVEVPVIAEAALMEALPPPYDLVKLDIEGAEYAFVRDYPAVCRAARAMVVEWHARSADDGRVASLRRDLLAHGFARSTALRAVRERGEGGEGAASGLELFWRKDFKTG